MRRLKWLAITITPFIWHRPHMDRGLDMHHVLRVGPINISGVWSS